MKITNNKAINKTPFLLSLGVLLTFTISSVERPVYADQDRIPISAEGMASLDQAGQIAHSAAIDLHLGNYVKAEDEARQAESLGLIVGTPEILATALEAQGKDQEAIQIYRSIAVSGQPRDLLPYAQLLLKSGQWAQAVAVYNQVLPYLPDVGPHPETPIVHDGDQITANSHFSPDVPAPAALAVALHIAHGMVLDATPSWAGGASQATEAMAEYGKALQLAPGNALANYYYGVGWHKLSPAERVKFGHADQAKAALQKAAQSDNPSVKKMAAEMLKKSN